ncbi:class II fructose-bisphosphate aldolase [Pelagibacterales bacterium SAG-MED31]|nr:class II fructose-bisphosphate aldolase [Pelagibacterales bacterium SAG-MED31]
MTAVNLKSLLNKANKNNYAVAGLVVITWEDALAFTEAADETGIPIILQAGPSCRAFTPISVLGKMFRHLADQTKTPICCHLDHGFSFRECKEGIDNGFTSVMFDGSKKSLIENINTSLKISNLAHKYNISVEGEIGEVGYFKGENSKGTDINEAKKYSLKSNVDAMAISVGNTHLQTSKIAKINYEKILEIQSITNLPLVLHGSSGISHFMRNKIARKTKVAKFNIGTELRVIACKSLRKSYNKNIKNFDKISIIKPSIKELKKETIKVIKNIGPKK